MMTALKAAFLCCLLYVNYGTCSDPEIEEEELKARSFLQHANVIELESQHKTVQVAWNYETNITEYNKKKMLETQAEVSEVLKNQWMQIKQFQWQSYQCKDMKRKFKLMSILGPEALPKNKFKKYAKLESDMIEIFSTAKVCDFKNSSKCDLVLEPEVEHIFSTSSDPEELKHYWKEFRDAIGPKVKQMYKEHVELDNEAAKLNNFSDTGEYWLSDYDNADIKSQVESLWQQVKPLYQQIHAYVRYHLRKKYGDVVPENGPIPAHLVGNMWGQTWSNVYSATKPFSARHTPSVTDEMVKQEYDYKKIFQTAEDFFVSLDLPRMNENFWKYSMLTKPKDREVVCHAAAYDFYDATNFRIKQCTKVTEESLITAHHEMGHIIYFMLYSHLPAVYRSGANEGFHEAVGDVIALSVKTTKHLRKLGLLKEEDNFEAELNNLYLIGLSKIAFLPFGYIMDLWRWDVFRGKTTSHDYNCKWWKLVEKYQGLEPPIDRSEKDFDPAAKFHIVANVPYLRYFVSFIIQFQFHRALCLKAGEYVPNDPSKPLYKCDIYQNKEAGKLLKNVLELGASRPWEDAMEIMTGQRHMDANGILEYFKPLQDWLEAENTKNNVTIGWGPSTKECTRKKSV